MTRQRNGIASAIVMLSIGVALGAGAGAWMTNFSTTQAPAGRQATPQEQRLARLEQAVTALTQPPRLDQKNNAFAETTCAASQPREDVSRQSIAQIIREELRQALANVTPEGQQARAEEIATTQALNSLENRAAYQSVSDLVHAALAAGRWTDEDGRVFRDAFVQLTNEQRMEVMQLLAPAINRGEILVETSGPLF